MKWISILFALTFLFSCGHTKVYENNGWTTTETTKGKISVRGIAENAKGGAIVVTADSNIYYLDNIDSWDNKFYGRQVEVKGKLKIRTTEITDTTVIIQYSPRMEIIMFPIATLNED